MMSDMPAVPEVKEDKMVVTRGVPPARGSRRTVATPGLHSYEQMQRVLRRERDLAARYSGHYSLVEFTAQRAEDWSTRLAPLMAVLREQLHCSDIIGWLDPAQSQLGVVLHRASGGEAWDLVDRVRGVLPPRSPLPECAVRYFPSDPSLGHDLDPQFAGPGRPVLPMEALFVQGTPLWKRAIDVVGAGLGLLALSPLLLVVAAAVKLSSRGPVFYSQPRRGWGGKRFTIHKFRSMSTDADQKHRWLMMFNEQDGPAFKMKNDPRVTAIGRFLRRTNLDELPQLWNVFRGDMSLVGPRPLICPEADACRTWQFQRLDVVPGITCIWQIYGSRDDFDGWIRLDLEYIRRRSFWMDVKLILGTVAAVFLGRRSGY